MIVSARPWRMALAAILLGAAPAWAQSFPTQRIQIIVPFSAGTVLDSMARVVAEQFTAELGQPAVVVNRPGAAGTIAFGEVAAAQPDGHTLIFAGQTQLTVQPHVKSNLPYQLESFAPVCRLFETPFALVVGADSPFKDFQTFAAAARAKPGSINFGHSGVAAVPHLQGTLLAKAAGFRMADIPYRSLGDQIKDVISGTIDATVLSIGSFSPGKVRAIAVFNPKRSTTFPDVPTVAELGYSVPLTAANGLFALNGSPPAVLERLRTACARAFASDNFRAMAAQLDVNAELVVGDDFARRIQDERREMKTLIGALGLGTR